MKIIFSGGGTLGPVVPLLAIAQTVQKHEGQVEFLWIGTKTGPERKLVEENGIRYIPIWSGKWRRYFSILNLFDVFKFFVAFFQSLYILWREKPDLLVSAGGYVSVPLHAAGALLAIPEWVHQQDVQIGLANKLMFPFASKVTTALKETEDELKKFKAEWIGNPSRNLEADPKMARKKFGLPDGVPVFFALGGGTGSTSINQLVVSALPQLNPSWQVIHLVGKERSSELSVKAAEVFPNYHVYEFFTEEMKDAYASADVVLARAGFSTLTELAALKKPAVILPMFDTHQEDNAKYFAEKDGIVLLQRGMNNGLKLSQIFRELVESPEERKRLGEKLNQLLPSAKEEKLIEIINKIAAGKTPIK